MTKGIERQIIELIATDRIQKTTSSMEGRLKRMKPKLAKNIDLSKYRKRTYEGERVYARVEDFETKKAKGMKEGIIKFKEKHKEYGKILQRYIDEERATREINLYFGINEGCRLTDEDYMTVMRNLKFTDAVARKTLPGILEFSRKLTKKRDEERSVLIG